MAATPSAKRQRKHDRATQASDNNKQAAAADAADAKAKWQEQILAVSGGHRCGVCDDVYKTTKWLFKHHVREHGAAGDPAAGGGGSGAVDVKLRTATAH